jgi:predicted small secreted protein
MKKIYGTVFAIMVIALLSGCANTGKGIGKDVENMGKWVQSKT